ncbi:MAG TPA: hypothetical protein VGX75_15150 [bacterium]|nr:hypothetical protein [bacterium]
MRPAGPRITWQRIWRSLFAEHALDLMLYLGALLFVVSAGALVIRYWTQSSPVVRTLIVLSGTGVFYAGGAAARAKLGAQHSGAALIGVGALLMPLSTVTVARVFGVDNAHWPLLWLPSCLVMLPVNLLTARWLRAEFFAYVTLASAAGAIVSASALAGLPSPWWGTPLVLAGTVFVLLTRGSMPAGPDVFRGPLRIAGPLLGLLAGPWVVWLAGGLAAYLRGGATLHHAAPVASAWGAAAVLGVTLAAGAPSRGYAYGAALAAAGTLALAAAAVAPLAWVGLGLVVAGAAGAALERHLSTAGETIAAPCRHVAWVCAALGGVWSLVSLDTAVPALALDAAGALWWARLYRRAWLWLGGLVLVAAALTAAMLRWHVPLAALGAGWVALGLVYLGIAHRGWTPAADAAAFYLAAYGLLLCAQAPALVWPSTGLQVLALTAALGVSAWSIRLGDRDRVVQALLSALPAPWPATLFTSITAVLCPLWSALVWRWVFGMTPGMGVMLCAIALAYAALGYRLARAASPRATAILVVTYLLCIAGPALALPTRSTLSAALALDTILLAGLGMGLGSGRLAGFAAAASLAAVLVAPVPVPASLAPPALAAVAFLYSLARARTARVRGADVFGRPLFWVSRAAAAVTLAVAASRVADGRVPSGLGGYASLFVLLVVWSLMDQEPWTAVIGLLIGFDGLNAAVDHGMLLRLGLQSGDRGPAWAALALAAGSAGIGFGVWRRSAGRFLPLAATVLAAAAMLEAIGRPASEWPTLSLALVFFGMCAAVQPRGRLPFLDGWVLRQQHAPASAAMLRAGYVYLCAWLLPFWVYLTLGRIPAVAAGRANLGVGLVLLAWAYLGWSRAAAAVMPAYEAPWLTSAPFVAAAGLVIAAGDRLPFVIAAGAATLLCLGFAAVLRTPRWLYPAAALAAPAWVLGLAQAGLVTQFLAPALLALGAGELALGALLDRRAAGPAGWIAASALPFWIVGFALVPPALLWAAISGRPVALSTFLAGAAVYAAGGLRFRDSLFSYPVTGLLGLSYIVAVAMVRDRLGFPVAQWPLWLLPGVGAAMAAACVLNRRYRGLRIRAFFARSPAAAATVLASGGAAELVFLASHQPDVRAWIAAAAGAVYAMGIVVARTPAWLYPALFAGHLAYGFAVWDTGLGVRAPLAVWFVPVTLAMTVMGMVASRDRDRGPHRSIIRRLRSAEWGMPFYTFGGVGLVGWLMATARASTIPELGARVLVLAAGTAIAAMLAWRWRDTRIGTATALFGAAAVAALFAWRQVSAPNAEPRIAAIALGFGALWWGALADAARRTRRSPTGDLVVFWTPAVRLIAIVLGAGTFGASVLSLALGSTGSDHAFVLCLALVGFLVLEVATLEDREILSYLALLMLEAAWGLWLYYDQRVRAIQPYAIPGALYLFWVGLDQFRRRRKRLAWLIDAAGLILLLGSSLLQSITEALSSSTLVYGGLVAVESLSVTWWGLARHVRRFVLAGAAVLVLDLTAQVFQPLLLMSRWVLTGVVGLSLIIGGLIVERQREAIAEFVERWRARMEDWG